MTHANRAAKYFYFTNARFFFGGWAVFACNRIG